MASVRRTKSAITLAFLVTNIQEGHKFDWKESVEMC
jgi:hypothetical protein